MGIVISYSTWAIVSGFVNCVPVAKFWDRELPGHCLSFEALWFFNASMNIATDLTLLILPMPLITQLQLPKRQKLALMGVFALGGLLVFHFLQRDVILDWRQLTCVIGSLSPVSFVSLVYAR
jgi:hypothetical protein